MYVSVLIAIAVFSVF